MPGSPKPDSCSALRPDLVTDKRPDRGKPPRAGVCLHPIDVGQTTNRGILSLMFGIFLCLGEELLRHVVDEVTDMVRHGTRLLVAQDLG
ncbi:hypothetical protein [Streptomyces sp. NPDC090994]|uniref:hypothetical protein n=1 Tax=Streptomyces sp. NPDC090994 TaxID=3365969 RepID=UPI00381C39EC